KCVLFGGHVVDKLTPASLLSVQPPLRERKGARELFKLDRKTLRKLDSRSLHEIPEERGHLTCLFIPFFPRAERFIMVLGKQDMHRLFPTGGTGFRAGWTAMGIVVSRHNAGWYLNCLEFSLSGTNNRQVGTLEKILPPMRHDVDKALGTHFHQGIAVLRSRLNPFFPVFHLTDFSHAPLFGGFNVLAVVLLRQPLTSKAPPRDPPKQ